MGWIKKVRLVPVVVVFLWCASASGAEVDDGTTHDLSASVVMDRTILAVMEHYYDSSRVDSVKMFKGAMDAIVQAVAEVKVSYLDEDAVAVVEALDNKITIPLSKVNSPWGVSKSFRKIFALLDETLPKDEEIDFLQIEYAAVNGLLSTLDPHTSAMTPELWTELRMSTQGEFEGVGIRITTDRRPPCDGALTVVEVFKGTPAERAGLRVGDKIIRIDGNSTVNITTGEAAKKLRGNPGTKVKVRLKRPDGSEKTTHIVRQKIPIDSVKWKLLDDNVGYIELMGFQWSSAKEMKNALRSLHAKGMKGLIFDLRGNPGGLLGAAIEIADLFIDSGTIVTTAGRRKDDREVTNASSEGTEAPYPLVILIDAYSASAAEIIAGAIRNHGRAILIGDTSFGKGSVQTIMQLPGGGALRLTIQQYLTPGDISIQAVGVAPDIKFRPFVVDREEMLISARERSMSEASLDAHLTGASTITRADRPGAIEAKYFVPSAERKADLETYKKCYLADDERKSFRNRYELEFARQLISNTNGVTSAELLLAARDFIEKNSPSEEKQLKKALAKINVDWKSGNSGHPTPEGEMVPVDGLVATAQLKGTPVAGNTFKISVSVKNNTKNTIHRLMAKTKSDNPYLSELDMVFGRLAPGRTKSWDALVDLPPVLRPREDPVDISFFSDEGQVPKSVTINVAVGKKPEPELVYEWYVEDLGNGNGFIEPGEAFKMYVKVTNIGEGATFDAEANLSSKVGINVEKGYFRLGILAPKQSKEGIFLLTAASDYQKNKATLHLAFDQWVPLKIPSVFGLLAQDLELPISIRKPSPSSASGTVTVSSKKPVAVFQAPDSNSRVVAHVAPNGVFQVVGKHKQFFKILLQNERHAWISDNMTIPGGVLNPSYTPVVSQLPQINIDGPISQSVSQERVVISGFAQHPDGIRDLLAFVDDQKIVYMPSGDRGSRLAFKFELPLEKGVNNVSIVARHDDKTVSSKTIFVRRNAEK